MFLIDRRNEDGSIDFKCWLVQHNRYGWYAGNSRWSKDVGQAKVYKRIGHAKAAVRIAKRVSGEAGLNVLTFAGTGRFHLVCAYLPRRRR